jgi:hypothetical protein
VRSLALGVLERRIDELASRGAVAGDPYAAAGVVLAAFGVDDNALGSSVLRSPVVMRATVRGL